MSPPRTVGETTGDYFAPDDVPLGSGSEAVVYLARRNNSGRAGDRACVKIFRDPKPEVFDKIRALIYQMRGFKFVAHMLEVALDVASKQPVGVVLEYCPGESLRDFIERDGTRELTTLQKATLCRDLAIAIGQFTTSRRIVPIDLSLQNIHLVLTPGVVTLVLLDTDSCWLLKQRKPSGTITDYPGPMGTPGYRAPELLSTPNLLPSAESTLWGLATVIFVILYGEHPCTLLVTAETQGIQEEDLVAEGHYPLLARSHAKYFAPRYDTNASEIPPYFDRLFRAALTGPAQHRPTARQWQEAFEEWFANELAPRRSLLTRALAAWLRFKRHFRLEVEVTARSAALVVMFACVGVLATFAIRKANETEQLPRQPMNALPPTSSPKADSATPPVESTPFWNPTLRRYFGGDKSQK